MKSTAVATGDTADKSQYNNLRQDAQGAATLLATKQSSPNMTLLIQAGSVFFGTTKVDYAGGNTGSFTAPVGNPRIDLVYITSGGTITILQGTAAASPVPPTTPAGVITICHVYLRTGTTAIHDTDQGSHGYILRDIRPFLLMPADVGANRQVFTATGAGTWTKPASGTVARVRVWGGGGSGGKGSAGDEAGAGGGGGGCTEKWFLLSDLGATESVSVGAGGAAQNTSATAGNVGNNSTFGTSGTLVTGYGGGGGGLGGSGGARGGGGGGGTKGVGQVGAATQVGGLGGLPAGASPAFGAGGAAGARGGDNAAGGGGGGGSSSTTPATGGSSVYGGGGGGGSPRGGSTNTGTGGDSVFGGGGGSAGWFSGSAAAAGTSINGGNGSQGTQDTAASAGSQPAGGGGGTRNGTSGAGGNGMVEVVVF